MSISEIRAEGLTVAGGGQPVIAGLDLHARAGEMLGITGPSGSGKTTLLYALGGLVAAASGSLLVDGRPAVLWRDTSVGIVLQNLCLVPLLSAQETVALSMQAQGLPRHEVAGRATATLERLGLGEHTAHLVGDLSGGQRQRVAVARALAGSPGVILADEPTSALDPHWRQVVLDLLAEAAGAGALVVLASSDPEVVGVCHQRVDLAG